MRWMMLSLAAGALVLSGCGSMRTFESNVDYERVARVEQAAKAVGVAVYWVNYPQKASSSVN
jgi:uncharacterized protein YceK